MELRIGAARRPYVATYPRLLDALDDDGGRAHGQQGAHKRAVVRAGPDQEGDDGAHRRHEGHLDDTAEQRDVPDGLELGQIELQAQREEQELDAQLRHALQLDDLLGQPKPALPEQRAGDEVAWQGNRGIRE